MPLYSALLCEAEIIMPASALYLPIRYATAGVGTTPKTITSAPTLQSPAVIAFANISEEILVSIPITKRGLLLALFESTVAAALPSFIASSQVKSVLAIPLTPSVPNNLPIKYTPFILIFYTFHNLCLIFINSI